ncbi:MAG: signal peptidase I [Actinobacteria bacterium]|nr:signal peptidase I [Actinomycetota bacterium]
MEAEFSLGGGPVLILWAAIYVYMAFSLMTIANKTGTENAWFAWVPILNVILMLQIADKPIWWIILFLIPIVNIVIAIMVWMAIAEARGFPSWWGILMIVPFVNFIVPGYLAFAEP